MYIRKIERSCRLLVYLITSSIMFFLIREACYTNVQASSLFMGHGQTKVVVIAADYLELEDISADPYLKQFFDSSSSALVSSRQLGKNSAAKVKLSIGSGKRLQINNGMTGAISRQEPPSNERIAPIYYRDIEELINTNKGSEYISYIGYLGDKLNALGKNSCIIGNSDTDIPNRDNILIAMDSKGNVDYGDIDSSLLFDPDFPGGKRTDFVRLTELYRSNFPVYDLMIIDTGDLSRLEYYKSKLASDQYKDLRKQTVTRISDFIRAITEINDKDINFILLSAYPSSNSIRSGFKLTPIVSFEGGKAGGLIYSRSTRREGIITSLDIADYIVEKLSTAGRSQLIEVSAVKPLDKLLELKRRLINVSVMRLPVLTWYAVVEIICGVLGLLYMLNMKLFKSKRLIGIIKATLLANICAPVILLYMAALDISNQYIFFIVFILGSLLLVLVIYKVVKDTIGRFAAAAFIVNISLMIDLFRNSHFIKGSVFGYDPIIGARFYGIGNEFAGVYLGSSILFAGCLLQRFKARAAAKPILTRLLIISYFALQIYIIGMPDKGANFGATIAALCGFYFFGNKIIGKKITIKKLMQLALIAAFVITMIVFIDLADNANTTHIGRFLTDIKENGIKVLMSTIGRKLEMNLRLMRYTIWTKVLLCIILIITIMFFKPVKLLKGIFKKYNQLAAAWFGISAGSIAGLIVNDSGIVMAATAMIFTGYTILYMCLEEMETGKAGG